VTAARIDYDARPMRRAFFLALLLLPMTANAESTVFGRAGGGWERGGDTTVRDVQCRSTNPPALFGCGFRAEGELASAFFPEVAVGLEVTPRVRFELALAPRSMELDANANFLGVTGEQPVTTEVRSTVLVLGGAVDLAPASWRVRPFVTAGAGLARNEIDAVVYAFPGLGPQALTVTRGGSQTDLVTTAGAGLTMPLSSSLSLDVAYRWTDLGEARTEAGAARIVRPARELTIDVDATRADVQASGVSVSLRWRL
jgi:opacity protein-like surface antigen